MDQISTQKFVDEKWNDEIVPELVEYIKIPNKSPHFDADWEQHGYMESAVQQVFAWCKKQPIPGMQAEIVRLPGRTPVIFMEIPGQSSHASPRLIEGLRCLPTKRIGAGGIPVAALQPRHHRLKNLRVDLRGGIVIEINHRTHGRSL